MTVQTGQRLVAATRRAGGATRPAGGKCLKSPDGHACGEGRGSAQQQMLGREFWDTGRRPVPVRRRGEQLLGLPVARAEQRERGSRDSRMPKPNEIRAKGNEKLRANEQKKLIFKVTWKTRSNRSWAELTDHPVQPGLTDFFLFAYSNGLNHFLTRSTDRFPV